MHFLERSKEVAEGTVGGAVQFEDGEAEELLGEAAIGDASAHASGGADADDVVVIDVWGRRRMRRRPRQLPPPSPPRHRFTGKRGGEAILGCGALDPRRRSVVAQIITMTALAVDGPHGSSFRPSARPLFPSLAGDELRMGSADAVGFEPEPKQ